MADIDPRPANIKAMVERAEGLLTDAEFREDQESKVIRYYQAIVTALLALAAQNEMIIELLSKQQAYGSLANE